MVSGADLRQAMEAGLWEALADGSDRAAMRATCRDARDMADELQDSAVLPVGPGTWGSAAAIAAYHRKLGAVRSLHVRYRGGGETPAEVSAEPEADEHAYAAQFVEVYSAALGVALPADSCTITMTAGRQLPMPFAAALLARVVPRVERLDIALGSYRNLAQLLTAMGPCTHLCSLRLLPLHDDAREHGGVCLWLDDEKSESVLDALCGLTRLHTLSGPWSMRHSALQRLCAALPSLTTLGFDDLNLRGASGVCFSRQLHTLAGWRHCACGGAGSQPRRYPWYLFDRSASWIRGVHNWQSSLPAVQQLESVVLGSGYKFSRQGLAAAPGVVQRFAACAERWAWSVAFSCNGELEAAQGLAQGSLAAMQHMVVELKDVEFTRAATFLRCLIAAAPNITMFAVRFALRGRPPGALVDILRPLCRAARLHTLRLAVLEIDVSVPLDQPAPWLAEAVRGLVRLKAEGECCPALKHVWVAPAKPGALHACRQALADGGLDVSLDACTW